VLFFGAYKSPREVTWGTGIILLLLVLAFGLTGYLLPWDQRAYWATVVTINIAKSTPVVGPYIAGIMRGGPAIGALTLSRWYATHVILLPVGVLLFVVTHLYLMRRHGIAGHFRPRVAPSSPFYPVHAVKDTIVIAAVFALLFSLAVYVKAPLEAMANPADATYVPRPEWYFLGLFQMLKYFPGKLEPIGAIGIPTLVIALLFLLPFLDRRPERDPRARPRVSAVVTLVIVAVSTLTWLGFRDKPKEADPEKWGPRAVAGEDIAKEERCTRCHAPNGAGPDLSRGRIARDDQWITAHVADPEMIAAGLRPPPADGLKTMEARAVIAFVQKVRESAPEPRVSPQDRVASKVFATRCVACHVIEGDGGKEGPDLTHEGHKQNAEWLARWISDPSAVDPDADMPSFKGKLSDAELAAISQYLAARK